MTATVIIPTTGSFDLREAVDSVLLQTYSTTCYVVVDGDENWLKTIDQIGHYNNPKLKIARLPINVGANGFYGHRVYAAFTHLVDTDYVLYLDQDNWFDKHHVLTCINSMERENTEWCYSLRKICDSAGNYLCDDNCESLGKWQTFQGAEHIDTNSYCISTKIAIKLASVWHGGWGQDRVFFANLKHHFPKYSCTGKHTVNYCLGGNEGSVKKEFFEYGNNIMNKKYNGKFPWTL